MLTPGGRFLFSQALEHLGQGGLIHGEKAFLTDPLEEASHGRIVHLEPILFGGDIDIAQANLLGWDLEPGPSVGAFPLFDEAFVMEEKETTPHHDSAFVEGFCNLCRGVHGTWF